MVVSHVGRHLVSSSSCGGMRVGMIVVDARVRGGFAIGNILFRCMSFCPCDEELGVAFCVCAKVEVAPGISIGVLCPVVIV